MREIVKVDKYNTVNQSVQIITCQCQYLVSDNRTGEKIEMTFRFVVPEYSDPDVEMERISKMLGFTVEHMIGIQYLHKTWVDASDLYMEGEQTFG